MLLRERKCCKHHFLSHIKQKLGTKNKIWDIVSSIIMPKTTMWCSSLFLIWNELSTFKELKLKNKNLCTL